jgi:hypothetical protein
MSTQPETRPDTAQAQGSAGEGLGTFGLIHLVACCGAAGAAVLAVILIQWLT